MRISDWSSDVCSSDLGLMGMVCTFGAVLLLPLAEAMTLQFTVPIFATILSALVLREPTGRHRWAAVVLGFAGVLIVVQPGSGAFPLSGALVGLLAARSEEHTSELQSLMRISYAVFCLKKKK